VLLIQSDPVATRSLLAAFGRSRTPVVEVQQVSKLAEAIERLGGGDIEVALLDLGLPEMSEADALHQIHAADPGVTLIGLARRDDPSLSRRAYHEGADDCRVMSRGWAGRLAVALPHIVERHRILAGLRLQSEQHTAIVEGSLQGIVIHEGGVIRYANPSIARLLGHESPADLLGQSVLALVAPHDRERVLAMARARERGESVPARYEFQASRSDATLVSLECLVTPITWRGRSAMVAVMLDITERKRTESAMRALAHRAAWRAENLAVLARVSSVIAAATDSQRVFEAVAGAAVSLLGAKVAGVLVDDPATKALRVGQHYTSGPAASPVMVEIAEVPYGRGVAAVVYDSRRPIFVEDIDHEPRWLNPHLVQEAGLHAYAGLPLIARDRVIGVLSIFFGEHRKFADEERELMGFLASQAAVAIDNACLLQETERRRRTAEAHAAVGRLLGQSLDLADVSDRIVESVRTLLGVANAALFRLRPETEDLEALSLRGDHGVVEGSRLIYPLGQGAIGLAARSRRPVVTSDLLADPRIPQPPDHQARMKRAGFGAVVAVPLVVQDRVIGALSLGDTVGRQFTDEEVQVVEAFADRAAIALETARLYQEVRDARDFLQSIAESSADAIVTTDVHGRITYWSPGAEEMFGYAAGEAFGRTAAEFYAGGPEEARAIMARLLAEGRLRDYEAVVRGKDGRTLAGSASISLLRDASGALTGTVGVLKDVTGRRMLEESLRQSQKMEAVGRLAGGIAHDFNNLMTVVLGRSDLLLRRLRPEDPMRRDIELFRKTAMRATELTRQLLAFSRKQVLQPKVLDLNAVVENMESMLRRLIGEDVALRTDLAPALGRVKADPGQIEQVIVNLVVNARDAMPQGGKLTIETTEVELTEGDAQQHAGLRPGPTVVLAVSDTGTGMDEATRARIFEPFFTTKEQGKGTGLGLSTVYGIVQQSDGGISVHSAAGRGTTFRIYLPRVEESVEIAPTPEAPMRAGGGTETVLLVEDEDELRAVVLETLQLYGYTVLEAGHGGEAMLMAERYPGPIHLLLTDVVMPTMSGADLARRLAAVRLEMKVLFVSGYTDDAIVHHGVLEPGTAFLEKPFNPEQLVRRVREVLSGRD
jgi:PAS domain S-box-containing protein